MVKQAICHAEFWFCPSPFRLTFFDQFVKISQAVAHNGAICHLLYVLHFNEKY